MAHPSGASALSRFTTILNLMTMNNAAFVPPIREFDSIDSLVNFQNQPALTSSSLVIDQEMISRFARVTLDSQWIHVDRERAKTESPYQETIAHGFLLLSLLTHWQSSCMTFPKATLLLNYGFDKLRFTGPVLSGSRVFATFALTQVKETRPDEARCAWQVTVQAEGAVKPSVHADWQIMVRY